MLTMLLHSPALRGAVGGVLVAAHVDFLAFRGWKGWNDAFRYDWLTASWRWTQGAAIGAATSAGLGALFG